jgi:hypothetical protein
LFDAGGNLIYATVSNHFNAGGSRSTRLFKIIREEIV